MRGQFGTDQSMQLAHQWISRNAADLNLAGPTIAEGGVILALG